MPRYRSTRPKDEINTPKQVFTISDISHDRPETANTPRVGFKASFVGPAVNIACISPLGSARLGSARLGSARLGSARLGSARLGSARLGSTHASAEDNPFKAPNPLPILIPGNFPPKNAFPVVKALSWHPGTKDPGYGTIRVPLLRPFFKVAWGHSRE